MTAPWILTAQAGARDFIPTRKGPAKISTDRRVGDQISASGEDPNTFTVSHFDADPAGSTVGRVNHHHVGKSDIALVLHDTTLLSTSSPRLQVPFLDSDLLDANAPCFRIYGQNTALFPTIGTLDDFDQVSIAPPGFELTSLRPSLVMVFPSGETMIKAGIPLIPNFWDKALASLER